MRNLKRVLSLALASIMLLGMMVVGAGAASKDFTDADEIKNVEAVDVMVALGILEGGDKGDFQPNSILTREQAAKIICYLLLGEENAEKLTTNYAIFSDVPANRWSAPYISYCVNLGILAGDGAGHFYPEGKLTGVAFAKMLLVALGYSADREHYVGNNWEINVSAAAIAAGISPKGLVLSNELSRQDAAQMAFNTLSATMVEYLNDSTIIVGDITVSTASKATPVAQPGYTNTMGAPNLQFAEKYFGKLTLNSSNPDAMNRPANTWIYKNKRVGMYTVDADYTFVVSKDQTAEKLIKNNLGKGIDQTGNVASVNGGTVVTTAATDLKVGDTVEIFMDSTNPETVATVAVTRYSVGRLTGDVGTKGKGDNVEVRLPGTVMSSYRPVDEVIGYEDLKKDDVIYFYKDNDNVYHVFKAESFDGKLTSIKNKTPYTYVVEGTDYVANGNLTPEAMNIVAPVFNTEYRFWVDNNGYVVYGDELEDALSDYVVIQEIAYVPDGSGIGNDAHIEALLVWMDGSTKVVNINSIVNHVSNKTCKWMGMGASGTADASANSNAASDGILGRYLVVNGGTLNGTVKGFEDDMFFTYTINSDGEYDLTYVNGRDVAVSEISDTGITLTAGKVYDGSRTIPVTDDTVFVVAKTSNGTKFDVYTGKNNAPDLTTAKGAYVTEDGVVTYMYIDAYTGSTFSGNTLFIMDDSPIAHFEVKKDDGTKYGYNTYKAAVNGKYEEVKIAASSLGTVTATGAPLAVDFFSPTYNEDGVITKLTAASNDQPLAYGYKLTGTTLVTGKTYGSASYANAYVCENDVPVFYMAEDGTVDEISASELSSDANDQIYVVTTNSTDNKVKFLVVMEKDADETGISLKASAGTLTADGSYVETIDGVAQTVTKYTLNSTSANVTVVTEAGAKVEYKTSSPYWSGMTNYTGTAITNPGSVNGWIAIKVTAEDTTAAYYSIQIVS